MKLLIAVIVAAGVFAGASARAGDAEKELRLSQAIDEALKTIPRFRFFRTNSSQPAPEATNLPTSKIPSSILKLGAYRSINRRVFAARIQLFSDCVKRSLSLASAH